MRRRRHSTRLIRSRRIAGKTPSRKVTTRAASKTSNQAGMDGDPVILVDVATLVTAHTTVSQAHQSLYTGAS